MEIQNIHRGEYVEVVPTGRLDEYWASHLESGLDQVIRGGMHRIRLNMSAVTYLSSAGIRILLQFYKQLHEINGSFGVIEPSPNVKRILDMTRLTPMLIAEELAQPAAPAPTAKSARAIPHPDAAFEVLEYLPGASMKCRTVGDPTLIVQCGYREEHVHKVSFPESTMGLGLGAFGGDFADCRGRFGEFLAVAGAAAYLPTDGTNVPDYMVSAGSFVPEVNVLYGLECEGDFAHLARFEATREARAIKLSDVIEVCLQIAAAPAAVIVLVVETAGLVGAALRRSPVMASADTPFSHPEIRNWISFTAEPAYAGSLCLLAGIAARDAAGHLTPLLRGLGTGTGAAGHFHAAAFRYRAIRKDESDLRTTVRTLFETRSLQGVLHVLADHRASDGAGESEFLRGACWIAPVAEMEHEAQ